MPECRSGQSDASACFVKNQRHIERASAQSGREAMQGSKSLL